MLKNEAIWLARTIHSLEAGSVFPLLNLGSSNLHFRQKEQPWIDALIFEPTIKHSYVVIHTYIKNDEGGDLVGDLSDPKFLLKLSKMNIRAVLCSNLLEHVSNLEEICHSISLIVPDGGYLFLTVPYKFPYHCDPIDTQCS